MHAPQPPAAQSNDDDDFDVDVVFRAPLVSSATAFGIAVLDGHSVTVLKPVCGHRTRSAAQIMTGSTFASPIFALVVDDSRVLVAREYGALDIPVKYSG